MKCPQSAFALTIIYEHVVSSWEEQSDHPSSPRVDDPCNIQQCSRIVSPECSTEALFFVHLMNIGCIKRLENTQPDPHANINPNTCIFRHHHADITSLTGEGGPKNERISTLKSAHRFDYAFQELRGSHEARCFSRATDIR